MVQVCGRLLLTEEVLRVLVLNRATRLIAFVSMRRHGVECFEIDCLGGKLLVLSRSVIVGVATCILLVNPSADCLQLIGSVPLQLVHGIHGQYGLIARLRFLGCILL